MQLTSLGRISRLPRPGLAGRLSLLLVAGLVPSFLLILEMGRMGHRDLVELQRERLVAVAESAAMAEAEFLQSIESQFRSLSAVPTLRQGDLAACRAVLFDAIASSPFLRGIGVATGDGWIECATGDAEATFVADRPWFEEAVRYSGLIVGGVARGRTSATRRAFVAKRFAPLPDGTVPGVLFGIVDLAAIPRIVLRGQFADQIADILILDREGIPIGRPLRPAEADRLPGLREVFRGASSGSAIAVGLNGERRLWGFATTQRFEATIALSLDLAPLTSASASQIGQTLGVLFALLGLYLLLGLVLARYFVLKPLQRLGEHAARVRGGDPTARVNLRGLPAEVRSVAVQMNRMAHRLWLRRAQNEQMTEELRAMNVKLATLAARDALTGLANRRELDRRLDSEWGRALRQNEILSILLLDVDHFKKFNDRYGHLAGDECLRKIADSIASVPTRPSDLCARYGGEEFAIVLPSTDGRGALVIAERIRSVVLERGILHEDGVDGLVTVSIGIASCLPKAMLEPAALIAAADQALYASKAAGRNSCSLASTVPGAEGEVVEFNRQRRR